MTQKIRQKHDQLVARYDAACEVAMDADRIKLTLDRVYPKAFNRIAEEMENMRLCRYTVIEGTTLWLMQPDFGMFADDDEFRTTVAELFDEENYNITYKD